VRKYIIYRTVTNGKRGGASQTVSQPDYFVTAGDLPVGAIGWCEFAIGLSSFERTVAHSCIPGENRDFIFIYL
jgi:hypothetical protein